MQQICDQTYLTNLTKRAYLALKERKSTKDNTHYMLLRAKQYMAGRSLQALFQGWRDAISTFKQRKMLAAEVEKFYEKKVMRKVHQSLVGYSIRRHNLSVIGAEV